jgi:hypothetical protein
MSAAKRGSGGRKPARKRAAKTPASRPVTRPGSSAVRKSAASTRRVAPTSKPLGGRPQLEIVRRPVPKPRVAPPEAFAQTSDASRRQRVLFELVRARAALLAAIQGLTAASADQPLEPGKWSVRETVLYACAWDDRSLRALEPALHGIPPDWAQLEGAELDQLNAEGIDALRHHGWDEALRLLQWSRQRLMESAEGVAEEPGQVWEIEHPLGALLLDLAASDRRHAEAVKRWRTRRKT